MLCPITSYHGSNNQHNTNKLRVCVFSLVLLLCGVTFFYGNVCHAPSCDHVVQSTVEEKHPPPFHIPSTPSQLSTDDTIEERGHPLDRMTSMDNLNLTKYHSDDEIKMEPVSAVCSVLSRHVMSCDVM